MGYRQTGSPLAFRVSQELVFDPRLGNSVHEVWEGSEVAITGLAAGFRAAGARVTARNRGPLWTLEAFIGSQPDEAQETAVEEWEFDMENVQVPIWSHPKVDAEMEAHNVSRAQYRKAIEEDVENGNAPQLPIATFPMAHVLYRLLSRGAEAYEIKRPVLARIRTYSATFAEREVLKGEEQVYTTDAMVRDFAIPARIKDILPAAPADIPVGTNWAWKQRRNTQKFVLALNKIEEVTDWTFAAWDTSLLYGLVA